MFHMVVDTIEGLLHRAEMTPTEIREAAMLACIRYDLRHTRRPLFLNTHVKTALRTPEDPQ